MSSIKSATELDLSICDQEKIHLIGEIQSYGLFLSCSLQDFKINLVSVNASEILGKADVGAENAIGRPLGNYLEDGLAAEIQAKIKLGILKFGPHPFEWKGEDDFDVFLFSLSESHFGIEICPHFRPTMVLGSVYQSPEEHLRYFLNQMKQERTIEAFSQLACRSVRLLTGLDRVMVYRFEADWNGDVIAEDRSASVHSFLGHKFPASDIPKPARDLYLRNQVRFILDSTHAAVPLISKMSATSKAVVDLSDSRLRAVSKYHLEYLANMGVTTSFSIAITVEGRLWGLIACHSKQQTYIPHSTRSLCQTLADTIALAAQMLEDRNYKSGHLEFNIQLMEIYRRVQGSLDPRSQIFREMDSVLSLFRAQGFALVQPEEIDVAGILPVQKDLKLLYDQLLPLLKKEKNGILALDRLSQIDPYWDSLSTLASGILCILLPTLENSILILFRSAHVQTIQWGGDPRKQLDARNYGCVINPRASFESWNETVKNKSHPWRDYEVEGIAYFKTLIFDTLVAQQRLINELSENLIRKSNS